MKCLRASLKDYGGKMRYPVKSEAEQVYYDIQILPANVKK